MTAKQRRPFGAVVLVAGLMGLGVSTTVLQAGVIDSGMSLPEENGHKGWLQTQRVRFLNRPLWQLASHAIAAGDFAGAYTHLRAILANDPQSNRARVSLIEVCGKLGRHSEAIGQCEELLAVYPDYADGYISEGFLAIAAGKPDLALRSFDALLQRSAIGRPQKIQAVQNAAELAMKLGRYDLAEAYGAKWVEWADGLKPRLLLMECAIKLQQWTPAVDHIDRAVEFTRGEPLRGELYLKKAYILVNLGRLREADDLLEKAKERLPGLDTRLAIERQLGFNAAISTNPAAAVVHFKTYLLESYDEAVARGYLDAIVACDEWELAYAEGRLLLKRPGLSAGFREHAQRTVLYACKHLNNALGVYVAARELAESTGKTAYLLDAAEAAVTLHEPDEAVRLYRVYMEKKFDPTVALTCFYLLKREGKAAEGGPDLRKIVDMPSAPADLRHAALYELAQLYREQKQNDRYFALMEELLKDMPESKFLAEYAVQLYGTGHYEPAAVTFARYYQVETNAAARYTACGQLADINLALQRPREAVAWLNRAAELGPKDVEWQFRMARAEYTLGEYTGCIDRLLPLAAGRDDFNLYIGFAFYKLKMPGLALLHLDRVQDCKAFTAQERFTLFSNRAYMQYDQDQDLRALQDVESALALQDDPDLDMVRLKALARLGRNEEAMGTGRLMIEARTDSRARTELLDLLKDHPDEAFKQRVFALLQDPQAAYLAEICQTVGVAAFRLDRQDEAIAWFTRALEYDPTRLDTYYVRGLAWFKKGKFKESESDFVAFYDRADKARAVPGTFWGDLGILEGKLKDFDLGTAALGHSAEIYVADVDSMRESGYQYMRWCHNPEAQQSFRDSIDFYTEILPYLEGTNADEYARARYTMLKENSTLDKTFGLQAYVDKTDLDAHTQGQVPVVQTIDGALPAQAGIMGTYRPPEIGFRDERQLDVFGRVLANFEPHSWSLDRDSYQGGVGAVYKPFVSQNYNVSFERLFKIGDNAENNWLWRNMDAWERGEAPRSGENWWMYSKIYGEIDYFLQDTKRWIYYIDGRLGPSFPLRPKMTLTVPELMGTARYQSDDPTRLGTYTMVGGGARLRVIEQERQYTTERWYVDAFVDYVWGWFKDTPAGFDQNDFHGVIFGVNFVK